MKKHLNLAILLLFALAAFILVWDYDGQDSPTQPDTYKAFEVAYKALDTIRRNDYEALARYIHPKEGVIFAPFSFIDLDEELTFSADQVSQFAADPNHYTWGTYANSSEPIELTASDYFKAYVYDKDYLNTDEIGINTIVRQGNSIENLKELFDGCIFVDFHDSGSEEHEGLDWSSLKIVMISYQDTYKIVAIIHSGYVL